MSIKHFILEASKAARIDGRSLPVIETDRKTAELLAKQLADEIGCRVPDLQGRALPYGISAMFDGVKIVWKTA